jgi:hypothetical protein
MREALKSLIASRRCVVDTLEHPTLQRLTRRLSEDYHILHFVGHAQSDPENALSYLILEDEKGTSLPVGTNELTPILRDTLLRLIVLNASEFGRPGERNAQLKLASSFVAGGIAAVAALQFPIPPTIASLWASKFYSELVNNTPVDAAISEVRKKIRTTIGADKCRYAPVLFMRESDGRILDVRPPTRPKGEDTYPLPPRTELLPDKQHRLAEAIGAFELTLDPGKVHVDKEQQMEAPLRKQLEEMAAFTFPSSIQTKLDTLMEKNNEGELTPDEYEELRALVDLNELVSILKGQAQLLLHSAQQSSN